MRCRLVETIERKADTTYHGQIAGHNRKGFLRRAEVLGGAAAGGGWAVAFVRRQPVRIEGQHIALAGSWETHPDYGRQLKVERVEIEMLAGAEGLAQFISPTTRRSKGIGPMRATKIAEAFEEDFEATLLNSLKLMAQAARVPLPAIEKLREVWLRSRHFNATMTPPPALG